MPFNDASDFDTLDKYEKLFKGELKTLKNEPSEFFFCEDYPFGKTKCDLLFVGRIKKPVIADIKAKAAKVSWGQVAAKDKSVKLEIEHGRVVEKQLQPLFKGSGFTFEVVDSIATPARTTEEEHDQRQAEVKARRALYTISETFKDMGHVLAGSDRTAIRKDLDSAEALIDQGKAGEAQVLIDKSAKELDEQKKNIREDFESRKSKLSENLAKELKDIALKLSAVKGKLDPAERQAAGLAITLKSMEEALKKPGIKKSDFEKRTANISEKRSELEKLQAALKILHSELDPEVEILKELADRAPNALKLAVLNMQNRLDAVDNASKSAVEMQGELTALVDKMGVANRWLEEGRDTDEDGNVQDDRVGTDRDHGVGRHGPQTGLDRQAQRVGTAEGVTPERPGNEHGTTQHTATWHKVTIVYEQDESGKKVIKSRSELEKNIVAAVDTEFATSKGSMWATPVLEREAVKKAIDTAKAMQAHTEYQDSTGAWKPFTSLAITLGKPDSSAGWGYGVERDGATVDKAVAANLLNEFEEGRKSLDDLLKDLNVKLFTRDGGVEMIHHAIVVFKRTSSGDKWDLVTHYPDRTLTTANVGWECARNWRPGNVVFRGPQGTATVNNRTLA